MIAYRSRDGHSVCTRNREVEYGEKFFARLGYPEQNRKLVRRVSRACVMKPPWASLALNIGADEAEDSNSAGVNLQSLQG